MARMRDMLVPALTLAAACALQAITIVGIQA